MEGRTKETKEGWNEEKIDGLRKVRKEARHEGRKERRKTEGKGEGRRHGTREREK